MSVSFSPMAELMSGGEVVVARFSYSCKRTGGEVSYTTKRELQFHAFSFGLSTTVWAPGPSRIAGAPFASAAWNVSGAMPNFLILSGHVST